jgi:predicted RNase H-like nuclease
MGTFIGLDGIPGGWVAVYLDSDGSQRFARARSAAELLSGRYDRAMIDMPIGLPERGYRQCDIDARSLVGSRVFLGARSGVWAFRTLGEANAHYWRTEGAGRGISMQLFCIREKLREINTGPALRGLFEAHPELIFWRIAGRVLPSKKSQSGREERTKLLEGKGIANLRSWLGMRRGTGIGRDDLIDACACAIAARDGTASLPHGDTSGGEGQARIWY